MESVYHFIAENSVLLLNGSFVQSAQSVRYSSNEPLFVTVLPLEAMYLPYTAEILNGKALSNKSLAVCCDMGDGHFYIELKPRCAYVFSPQTPVSVPSASAPAQLLAFVREGNFSAARSMLTSELSDSISDEALADFFDGVIAVRENTFTPQKGYLLVKSDGTAPRCDIAMRGGLIENIVL